jgi:hypothetical protein
MNATMRTLDFGALLVGTVLGAVLGQWLGLRETLFVAVAGSFVAAAWLAVSPVARLREMPAVVAVEAPGEMTVEGAAAVL